MTNKLTSLPCSRPSYKPFRPSTSPLTLSDIVRQTAQASTIRNIPPDIQLAFFLGHRDAINRFGDRPVKDEASQSLNMTRVIWFWRLDEARQFQRFHDTMRWNTAMFVALLTLCEVQSRSSYPLGGEMNMDDQVKTGRHDTPTLRDPSAHVPTTARHDTQTPRHPSAQIPAAARRFMTKYLAAVLEHHNTPLLFTARESFINTWKNSAWDVYTVFRGAQKKLLKNLMKRLNKDWEDELDFAEKSMSAEEFQKRVGKFVGSLVSRQREQGVSVALSGKVRGKKESGNTHMSNTRRRVSYEVRHETNELLAALRVPFTPQPKDKSYQTMRPRDMLPVLLRLFPAASE
ncbi:hypothetical protein ACJQWK_08601 [Exserohilum turcicum]